MEQKKEYYAFISYKREDEKWAKWLANELEHYHLPTTLNGKNLPKNLRPIFRDVDELSAGNLPEQIYHALSISKNLIVVCSPRSANSEWVDKEITDFIKIKGGKAENIYPFIIEGEPFAKNLAEECFPTALKELPESEERLGGNVNEQGGRNAAVVKIIAGMLGIGFDSLWQKYEREQRKKRNWIIAVTIFAFFCISLIAFWMFWQKQQTEKANWKMMENQARAVAEKARKEIQRGNVFDSMLALLEVVSRDNKRPYVGEVESVLREAYDSLFSGKWNYRRLESSEFFSDDGNNIGRKDTIPPQIRNRIINWYKSFGLPRDIEIIAYNKIRNIALIEKPIHYEEELSSQYFLVVYDCNNNKEVLSIDNNGQGFDISDVTYVCHSSFSEEGKKLLLSYSYGGGTIINLDDLSFRDINCGNEYCDHYSNWYDYAKNGRILHSSRFENSLKILDGISLSVIDSISAPNGEEIWDAYMNNENRCLMHSGNDNYLFYKFNKSLEGYCSLEECIKYKHSIFNEDTLLNNRFYLSVKDERLRFNDLLGTYKDWQHDGDFGCQVLGIIDGKYLVVDNMQRFFGDYSVIELFSGVEMCHFQNVGQLHYNSTTRQFLLDGYFDDDMYRTDTPLVYSFPSYDDIILKCSQMVDGMQLTDSTRRLFFLE